MEYVEELLKGTWKHLSEIKNIKGDYPGLYILAHSEQDISGSLIELKDIFYAGMSTAKKGVKSRLEQFINSANGLNQHSAGKRFFKDYCSSTPYNKRESSEKLFFNEISIVCNVIKSNRTPDDIRMMGQMCLCEYEILARVKATTNFEPPLNKK